MKVSILRHFQELLHPITIIPSVLRIVNYKLRNAKVFSFFFNSSKTAEFFIYI